MLAYLCYVYYLKWLPYIIEIHAYCSVFVYVLCVLENVLISYRLGKDQLSDYKPVVLLL